MFSPIFRPPFSLKLVSFKIKPYSPAGSLRKMSPESVRRDVLLVGFGAMGVIYAYVLQKSGMARVTAIARSNYEAVQRDGIHIMSGMHGDIPNWKPYRLCPSFTKALDRPYSYVLIATKVLPELTPTSSIISPLLSPSYTQAYPQQPAYVLLQNGLEIEKELYDAVSKVSRSEPRILSCTLNIGANLLPDNAIWHSTFDRLCMGLYKPGNYTDESQTQEEINLLTDIGGIFSAGGTEVTLVPEIQRHRFRKNFWNIAFSTISTLSGHPLRAIFQEPSVEPVVIPIIRSVMLEKLAVGRAIGFDEVALPSSIVDSTIESTRNIHRQADSKHKPSMLLDRENGKPMEIEVIVGEVVRKARELGVPTPHLDTIYACLLITQKQILKQLDSSSKTHL